MYMAARPASGSTRAGRAQEFICAFESRIRLTRAPRRGEMLSLWLVVLPNSLVPFSFHHLNCFVQFVYSSSSGCSLLASSKERCAQGPIAYVLRRETRRSIHIGRRFMLTYIILMCAAGSGNLAVLLLTSIRFSANSAIVSCSRKSQRLILRHDLILGRYNFRFKLFVTSLEIRI